MTKQFCKHKDIEALNNPAFTKEQLHEIRKRTPASEVQNKTDENGRKYKTVSGAYMKKRLNIIFGWDWDFQIIDREFYASSKEVIVQGRLSIRSTSLHPIIREQFGKHYLENKTTTSGNVSRTAAVNIGNGFKSAATDAFKKCASEIGLCWDVYTNEAPEGEPEAPEMNHQDKKVFERLEHFFKACTTSEEVESTFSTFEEEAGTENVSEEIKALMSTHIKRLI